MDAIITALPPDYTGTNREGQRAAASLDNAGNLRVASGGGGTAGTPAGNIGSVQGVAGGTPVPVSGGGPANVDTAALITLAAAAASTVNSADQTNTSGRGVILGINITAATAMTLTINIQGKDAASGVYYNIASSAALAAAAFTTLTAYPGVTVAANVALSFPLPKTWRVQAVVTGTSVTATIGASVIV